MEEFVSAELIRGAAAGIDPRTIDAEDAANLQLVRQALRLRDERKSDYDAFSLAMEEIGERSEHSL